MTTMAIPKIFIFLTILSIISTTSTLSSSISPSPSVDCSNLIQSLADCLSYVSSGSTVSKPEAGCCSGLKTVLKTAPQCLCEGFKSSAQLGIVLDVPKALALPSACHVSAPSVTNCKLSNDTGDAPVSSPTFSPTAGSPSLSEINVHAPALAPANSEAPFLSISILSLVVGMVLASSACF